MFGDVFGRALGDELAALFAGFGAEVEDPVGGFDDFEVVFDDEQGVAGIDEFLENGEKALDIGEVEAGGGFIQNEQF
jgi:hypothetical protein